MRTDPDYRETGREIDTYQVLFILSFITYFLYAPKQRTFVQPFRIMILILTLMMMKKQSMNMI